MSKIRRFLVFLSLSFAFGGFLFYAGVVVPNGTAVLDATTQGFVTQRVTNFLNLAVAVSMVLVGWDGLVCWKSRSQASNIILLCVWAWICASCVILAWLHGYLDALLDADSFSVDDADRFYLLHRVYLWTSTLQWLASLPLFWVVANSENSPSAVTKTVV